jgi:hypothetical protein
MKTVRGVLVARRQSGDWRSQEPLAAWTFALVPEVDGVVELDADLFAAFGIAEAVDDLSLSA